LHGQYNNVNTFFHLQSLFFYDTFLIMKIQIEIPIREYVQNLIKSKGFTQTEIKRRSGVSQAVLSLYLSGKRDITAGTLEKILMGLK